jgi:hypothetical protein
MDLFGSRNRARLMREEIARLALNECHDDPIENAELVRLVASELPQAESDAELDLSTAYEAERPRSSTFNQRSYK